MLEPLFNKVAGGLQVCNFLKRRIKHRYFPVNIVKLLRTASFIEPSGGCVSEDTIPKLP